MHSSLLSMATYQFKKIFPVFAVLSRPSQVRSIGVIRCDFLLEARAEFTKVRAPNMAPAPNMVPLQISTDFCAVGLKKISWTGEAELRFW